MHSDISSRVKEISLFIMPSESANIHNGTSISNIVQGMGGRMHNGIAIIDIDQEFTSTLKMNALPRSILPVPL